MAGRSAARQTAGLVAFTVAVALLPPPAPTSAQQTATRLVAAASVTVTDAHLWAQDNGAHSRFVDDIVPALFAAAAAQAAANAGRSIDPAVLVAQAALETGWGHFSGVVPPSHHNTAGIKTATGGADTDPSAHEQFPSWAEGARAQVNHLAAYTGLVPVGSPHGRFHVVARLPWAGTVTTVEELGARWAPSSTYGTRVATLTAALRATTPPPKVAAPPVPTPPAQNPTPPTAPPASPPAPPARPAPEEVRVADPVWLSAAPAAAPRLGPGARGGDVVVLQRLLSVAAPSADFSSGPGLYGRRTTAAVRRVQRAAGLAATGQADRCVWTILWPRPPAAADPAEVAAAAPELSYGDCGPDVAALHILLERQVAGFTPDHPAVFGRTTRTTVRRLNASTGAGPSARTGRHLWEVVTGD